MAEIATVVSGDVTVKKVIGALTVDEWLREMDNFYLGRHVTKNVILDLSRGSLKHVTYDNLRIITDHVRTYAHTRTGGKTAIVAPTDVDYGISRMFNALTEIEDIAFYTQTFRNFSEAAKWVGSEKLPSIE